MQYCNGGSLDELIWHDGQPTQPKGPLRVPQIWHLLLDILLGLQHLHRQGILHRDLKPTNILLQLMDDPLTSRGTGVGGPPRALLSDFGTSAPFGEAPTSGAVARGYTGTVEYTSPELLEGVGDPSEYTEKSDMWSLGIVLYAMCYSSLPFQNDDPHVLKAMICRFVEERRALARQVLEPSARSPLFEGGDAAEAASWLPPDGTTTPAGERGSRLGHLRLVMAALLAFDSVRRPSTSDLLENPVFRGQAVRHVRRANEYAALPGDDGNVIDLTEA